MDARASQLSTSALMIMLALACNVVGASGTRLLAWTPLLFFAPGYLLSDLLFKRDRLAAILTGVVMSICLNIFGGLILGSIGQITLGGWSVWVCLMFSGCLYLRSRASESLRMQAAVEQPTPMSPRPINRGLAMALAVAGLMTGLAYWIAMRSEAADSQFSFIEFWMLPGDNLSELTLGLTNQEAHAQSFRIEVSSDGVTTAAWTTDEVKPGQTLQSKISISPKAQRVTAKLFRKEDPTRIIRLVSRATHSGDLGERTR